MHFLEHVHVNVDSIAATESFLRAALPDLEKRGSGNAPGYGRWAHLGTDRAYIALTEVQGTAAPAGLRHIGLVVEDLDGMVQRLAKAGFHPADVTALAEHPARRRIYYLDQNGLDWEFVEYLSDDPQRRNDYS